MGVELGGRTDLPPLLEVKNLHTEFRTGAGIVRAVDGISYTVDPGETVAIVGESGSGKSVSALSLMRLIPDPPGRSRRQCGTRYEGSSPREGAASPSFLPVLPAPYPPHMGGG